jgi:hypothetical protein
MTILGIILLLKVLKLILLSIVMKLLQQISILMNYLEMGLI